MRPYDVIQTKRDGGALSHQQIDAFVSAAAQLDGSGWAKYHLSALLMAIYLKGMNPEETAYLARAMADSGKRYNFSGLPDCRIDKHSTGGVGDKTSLILGPLAAASGVIVPMMSGRGLGHTGGTLDKLESISGFNVNLNEQEFRAALKAVRLGMIGQSNDIAPADKTLYALRDVTATVESIPLITASILSKKLAEGINGLVMDVKCGYGAFMKTLEQARELARSLMNVGAANGLKMSTFITSMDVPLGCHVGNALEVIEAFETLKGNGPRDLTELTVLLAARMVKLAGLAKDDAAAKEKVRAALASGAGLEVFRKCIEQQGGDPRVIDDYTRLPNAPRTMSVVAPRTGYVGEMVAGAVGVASMVLGGGRERSEDGIDHAVGLICRAKPGEFVTAGATVYEVHYRSTSRLLSALPLLEQSFTIVDEPPDAQPLLMEEFA